MLSSLLYLTLVVCTVLSEEHNDRDCKSNIIFEKRASENWSFILESQMKRDILTNFCTAFPFCDTLILLLISLNFYFERTETPFLANISKCYIRFSIWRFVENIYIYMHNTTILNVLSWMAWYIKKQDIFRRHR